MSKLEVTIEPHLVECNLICKVANGKHQIELSNPVFLLNLTLEDFEKAIELLCEYKNKK